MIELKGNWTEEDIDIYLKNNPSKFIIVERRLFVKDVNE